MGIVMSVWELEQPKCVSLARASHHMLSLPGRQWRDTHLLIPSGVKPLKETLCRQRNKLIATYGWLSANGVDNKNVPGIFYPPQTEARKRTKNMALDSENS